MPHKVRILTIENIVNCIEFENIDNPIWILSILKHDLLFKKDNISLLSTSVYTVKD